jgi:hypothetical protein
VDLSTAAWHKSSYSGDDGCVEVALVNGKVAVRDSKNRSGPILLFAPVEWKIFISEARTGKYDMAHPD